jgi:hypothetical protein
MWSLLGWEGGQDIPMGAPTFLFSKILGEKYEGKLRNQKSFDFLKVESEAFCKSLLGWEGGQDISQGALQLSCFLFFKNYSDEEKTSESKVGWFFKSGLWGFLWVIAGLKRGGKM